MRYKKLKVAGIGTVILAAVAIPAYTLINLASSFIVDGLIDQEIRIAHNKRLQKRYDSSYKKMLSFANKDGNNYVDFDEKVDAWKRMGYDRIWDKTKDANQFPKPKLDQLEDAIKSYKR